MDPPTRTPLLPSQRRRRRRSALQRLPLSACARQDVLLVCCALFAFLVFSGRVGSAPQSPRYLGTPSAEASTVDSPFPFTTAWEEHGLMMAVQEEPLISETKKPNRLMVNVGRVGGAGIGAAVAYRLYPYASRPIHSMFKSLFQSKKDTLEECSRPDEDTSSSAPQSSLADPSAEAQPEIQEKQQLEQHLQSVQPQEEAPAIDARSEQEPEETSSRNLNDDQNEMLNEEEEQKEPLPNPLPPPTDAEVEAGTEDFQEAVRILREKKAALMKAIPDKTYFDEKFWSISEARLRFASQSGVSMTREVMSEIVKLANTNRPDKKIGTRTFEALFEQF